MAKICLGCKHYESFSDGRFMCKGDFRELSITCLFRAYLWRQATTLEMGKKVLDIMKKAEGEIDEGDNWKKK